MQLTLKPLFFAAFLAVCMAWGGGAQAATKPPLLVPEGKQYLLSYQLADTDDAFWGAVNDGARAGRKVLISHVVHIKSKGFLFHKTLGKKTWRKFVTYNLFENAYSFGANEATNRRTTRPELVQDYVMGIVDEPFIARHTLEPNETYDITITLEVSEKSEEESWLRFLPFTDIFKQKLTRSFAYVAPE